MDDKLEVPEILRNFYIKEFFEEIWLTPLRGRLTREEIEECKEAYLQQYLQSISGQMAKW